MNEREPYDWIDVGLVGHATTKATSYDGLTDEEADELKAELDAREARRIPLGFRAPARPRRVKAWPRVPRFDIPPR